MVGEAHGWAGQPYGRFAPESSSLGRAWETVDLKGKMLRPQHLEALMAAVNKYQVTRLKLDCNQLGPEGGAKLAEALQTNTTLKGLVCALAALSTDAQRSLLCGRAPE